MAIYHCHIKSISRRDGGSAVAAAAYRSASLLTDVRDGTVHDYSQKGGVVHGEIVLPGGAGFAWARDRETLWNRVEAAEGRVDSRVAREYELALPRELSAEAQLELARGVSTEVAERYGMAVDFSIHPPESGGAVWGGR